VSARNSWAVSASPGGIITTEDARLHIGALITPGSTNVKARTGLRPGASTAAGSPGLVAAQSTPDKTVKVNAFQMFMQTGRGAGSYIQCLDVNTNIDLLTAHPADPSLQRNDLIIAQQDDTGYGDGDNLWKVYQVVGTPSGTPVDPTPSGSSDYITLARVRVTALAGTITASMIDDLRPPWAVALGGVLPVKNATDRATLTPYDGMTIWRSDRTWVEIYSIAAGGWLVQDAFGTSLADIQSAVTTPYAGQLAMLTTGIAYVYVSGAWQRADSTAFGGKRYVTGGTIAGPTSGGTEALINVNTGSITFEPNSEYELEMQANYNCTVSGDTFNWIIRETNLSGTVIMQAAEPDVNAGIPLIVNRKFILRTTAAITKTYVGSIQRISGTGTASITASSNGSTYFIAKRLGPNTLITEV